MCVCVCVASVPFVSYQSGVITCSPNFQEPPGAKRCGLSCQWEAVLLYDHRDPPGSRTALILQQGLLQVAG